jgi:hypothetical protein
LYSFNAVSNIAEKLAVEGLSAIWELVDIETARVWQQQRDPFGVAGEDGANAINTASRTRTNDCRDCAVSLANSDAVILFPPPYSRQATDLCVNTFYSHLY